MVAYGLVSSNAKWQNQSYRCFLELGLQQLKHVLQLFYSHENGALTMLVPKIVDDTKVEEQRHRAKTVISQCDKMFKLSTLFSRAGII